MWYELNQRQILKMGIEMQLKQIYDIPYELIIIVLQKKKKNSSRLIQVQRKWNFK